VGRSGAPVFPGVLNLKGRLERMFTGRFYHNLDEKGRLTIPSQYRTAVLEKGAVITQGFDQNLMVLLADDFNQISNKVRKMSLTDPEARLLRRVIYSGADQVFVDKSGRVLISQDLREYAGMELEVVIVGVGDHFEIWSASNWANQKELVQNAQENAQRFISLELTSF
jgi:MraZ protein